VGGAVGLDPLTAFLIPVVIALAFTLLARRFPARRSGESAPARAPAKTFRIGFGAAYFGLWLLTSGAAAWVLLRAAAWLGPHQQPEDIALFRSPYLLWLLVAMAPTLVGVGFLVEGVARRYWPAEFEAYQVEESRRTGVDWKRLEKRLEKPIVVGVLILDFVLFLFALDFWSRFGHDRLVVSRFWSFGSTVHLYRDLDAIALYRDVDTRSGRRRQPSLVLKFRDGFVWDSRYSPVMSEKEAVLRRVGASVGRAAGHSIREEFVRP